MTETNPSTADDHERIWRAVADLHHDMFLGLVLTVLSRKGPDAAAEFVFNIFRRQQRERFRAGLVKLGLDRDPPAVAAAKYHYLSNKIGGVDVEFMPEHDAKAWIRYAPPRWIWKGVAMCAIPRKVSEAMLWGWHANNGVMLGRLSLGFVCTKQGVDAQDGLEGYYFDHGRDLEPHERLRFARDEEAPMFDPAKAPVLASDAWPAERLARAHRNYAMEYARSAMLEAANTFGPIEGEGLMRAAFRIVGMQGYRATAAAFGMAHAGEDDFGRFLSTLIEGQGDAFERLPSRDERQIAVQQGWRLMEGAGALVAPGLAAWGDLLQGLGSGHSRRCRVLVSSSQSESAAGFEISWEPHRRA